MIPRGPITLADEAEERSAADALRAATNAQELVDAWWTDAEAFQEGTDAHERLLNIYMRKLRELGAMQP